MVLVKRNRKIKHVKYKKQVKKNETKIEENNKLINQYHYNTTFISFKKIQTNKIRQAAY